MILKIGSQKIYLSWTVLHQDITFIVGQKNQKVPIVHFVESLVQQMAVAFTSQWPFFSNPKKSFWIHENEQLVDSLYMCKIVGVLCTAFVV